MGGRERRPESCSLPPGWPTPGNTAVGLLGESALAHWLHLGTHPGELGALPSWAHTPPRNGTWAGLGRLRPGELDCTCCSPWLQDVQWQRSCDDLGAQHPEGNSACPAVCSHAHAALAGGFQTEWLGTLGGSWCPRMEDSGAVQPAVPERMCNCLCKAGSPGRTPRCKSCSPSQPPPPQTSVHCTAQHHSTQQKNKAPKQGL